MRLISCNLTQSQLHVLHIITLNTEKQAIEDAKKLNVLEQQLAYVQWKKRKNSVKMKEAIAV